MTLFKTYERRHRHKYIDTPEQEEVLSKYWVTLKYIRKGQRQNWQTDFERVEKPESSRFVAKGTVTILKVTRCAAQSINLNHANYINLIK